MYRNVASYILKQQWQQKMHNVNQQPFGEAVLDAQSDLRLAYSTLSAIDFDSGFHMAMAHTNDVMYALYEMLPFDKDADTEENSRASFGAATRVARRDRQRPLEDFNVVGVSIDKRKGASWYLHGNKVFNHPLVGQRPLKKDILYDLGGQGKEIEVKTLHAGWGHWSMLDAVQPQNDYDAAAAGIGLVRLSDLLYHLPSTYDEGQVSFVDEGASINSRLFGQGATLKITNFKVEYRC